MPSDKNENGMTKIAGRLSNIVLLGFFAVLTSLPVITIGPSFSALSEAMGAYLDEDEDKPLRVYFRSFKEHFLVSLKVFVIFLLLIIILVWDLLYYQTVESVIDILGQTCAFVLLAGIVLELTVVFYLIPREKEEKVIPLIRKGYDVVMYCPVQAMEVLFINLAIVAATLFVFRGIFLFMPGVIVYADHAFLPSMMKKYKFKKGNTEYQKGKRKQ